MVFFWCFLIKIILVSVIIEPNYVYMFIEELAPRVWGGEEYSNGGTTFFLFYLTRLMKNSIQFVGLGSGIVNCGLLAFAIVAHVVVRISLIVSKALANIRRSCTMLLLSSPVIVVWYMIFASHAIKHSWMPYLLVWPVTVAFLILVTGIANRPGRLTNENG